MIESNKENEFEATNINSLWLMNVFENLKNLERMQRLAKEGCSSVMEYLSLPIAEKELIIADVQYKNLRFIVGEIDLLLTDLTPVIEEKKIEKFRENLSKVVQIMNNRKLFVHEPYSQSKKQIITRNLRPLFYDTLQYLTQLKVEIIKEISHILYVKGQSKSASLEKNKVGMIIE